MPEATRPIALIPSDCFRWQPRVQFIDSFRTRDAALDCALQHGYNLIVERDEGSSTLFDVLEDPEGACSAGLDLELLQTEEVLVDPDAESWTKLMLITFWHLTSRLAGAVASLYVREIAPRLRQAVSRRRRAELQRAFRCVWNRHVYWGTRGLLRRLGLASNVYRPDITPRYHQAASKYWWSSSAVRFRRWCYRHSHGNFKDLTRRFAASVTTLYFQQIVPRLRSAASRCWWTGNAVEVRRWWHRHSQGSVSDLARRLGAGLSGLYAREVTPRLRHAVSRCRQADIQGACHRAWNITLSATSRLTRQFPAVVGGLHNREISPFLSRAWNTSCSTASGLARRFAAAVACLYLREIAPRLYQAAIRYQQADIKGAFGRGIGAVASPRHTNSSQLG